MYPQAMFDFCFLRYGQLSFLTWLWVIKYTGNSKEKFIVHNADLIQVDTCKSVLETCLLP